MPCDDQSLALSGLARQDNSLSPVLASVRPPVDRS
jgi:hypothetical protein